MVPQWDRSVNARLIEAFGSAPFGPESSWKPWFPGSQFPKPQTGFEHLPARSKLSEPV